MKMFSFCCLRGDMFWPSYSYTDDCIHWSMQFAFLGLFVMVVVCPTKGEWHHVLLTRLVTLKKTVGRPARDGHMERCQLMIDWSTVSAACAQLIKRRKRVMFSYCSAVYVTAKLRLENSVGRLAAVPPWAPATLAGLRHKFRRTGTIFQQGGGWVKN